VGSANISRETNAINILGEVGWELEHWSSVEDSKGISVLADVVGIENTSSAIRAIKFTEGSTIEGARRLIEASISNGGRRVFGPTETIGATVRGTLDLGDLLAAKGTLEMDVAVNVVVRHRHLHTGDGGEAIAFTTANEIVRARTASARAVGVDTISEAVTATIASVALVNINAAGITITLIAVGARGADTSFASRVNALNKWVTTTLASRVILALIVVYAASETSTSVELGTVRAVERTWGVNTVSVGIARV